MSAAAAHITVRLEINTVPPSLNALQYGHWTRTRKQKRAWQSELEILLMAAGAPRGWKSAHASATLRFPQGRRRDEGNYRYLLEKALGDALVNGGWLPDDTPEHFRFGRVLIEADPGPARSLVAVHFSSELLDQEDQAA